MKPDQTPPILESGFYDIMEPRLFPWVPPHGLWYAAAAIVFAGFLVWLLRRNQARLSEEKVVPYALSELSNLGRNPGSNIETLIDRVFSILIKVTSLYGMRDVAALTADQLSERGHALVAQKSALKDRNRGIREKLEQDTSSEDLGPLLILLSELQRRRYAGSNKEECNEERNEHTPAFSRQQLLLSATEALNPLIDLRPPAPRGGKK